MKLVSIVIAAPGQLKQVGPVFAELLAEKRISRG